MALPKFEVPTGVIDGVNDTFSASIAYTAGTLAVYLNGQLIDFGAFAELSPAAGTFRITSAECIPKTGVWGSDELRIFFLDTSADAPFQEVQPLNGSLEASSHLDGRLDVPGLAGGLAPAPPLSGALSPGEFGGTIEAADQLSGVLEECN